MTTNTTKGQVSLNKMIKGNWLSLIGIYLWLYIFNVFVFSQFLYNFSRFDTWWRPSAINCMLFAIRTVGRSFKPLYNAFFMKRMPASLYFNMIFSSKVSEAYAACKAAILGGVPSCDLLRLKLRNLPLRQPTIIRLISNKCILMRRSPSVSCA